MRLRILPFVLLALPGVLHAQGLTNAQVYDFAIGDIFYTEDQWYGGNGSSSPLFVRDSVMNVEAGVGGYAMLFTIRTQRFRGTVGPFDPEDTTYTYQFGYVNGSDLPDHYIDAADGSGCDGPYVPSLDTVQANALLCGRTEWRRDYEPSETCPFWGPPSPWFSYFVAGCGGPYYLSPESYFGDIFNNHELIYYRKNGEECGADLPMGVRARAPEVKPVVYPDPVAHVLRWTGVPQATGVRIVDARGGTVMALPSASEVDVTALAPGVYVLQLLDHDRVYRARFVKR